MPKPKEATRDLIRRFHGRVDDDTFDAIWEAAQLAASYPFELPEDRDKLYSIVIAHRPKIFAPDKPWLLEKILAEQDAQ